MPEQTVPAEPGAAVTDRDGDTWRRCLCDGNDRWTDGDYVRTWAGLWHNHGPITTPTTDPQGVTAMPDLSPTARAALDRVQAQLDAHPDAVVTNIPDDGDYDHRLTEMGLLHAQVCTRGTPEEAAAWLTDVRPPGTTYGRWEHDPDHGVVTCEQFPDTHRHVICVC